MTIGSFDEILKAAKELVYDGKKVFTIYREDEMVYRRQDTKLGKFKKLLDSKDYSSIELMYSQLNKGKYPNYPFQGMLIERIDKPEKPRMIKVPSVTDRIVYSMLLNRIENLFIDDINNYPIYGLKGKGVSLAMERLAPLIKKDKIILKLDFQGYFDTIPRGKLLNVLRSYKLRGEEMALLKAAIHAPTNVPTVGELAKNHAYKFKPYETKIGLPQGCAFSPILASVYALEIEKYLKNKNIESIRYIDDIIIMTDSIQIAWTIYNDIKNISEDLGLILHTPIEGEVNDKSYITEAKGEIRFLGLDIVDGKVLIPEDKINNFINKLKEKSSEKLKKYEDCEYRNNIIVSFIRGWSRYYREHSDDWNSKKLYILDRAMNSLNEEVLGNSTKLIKSTILIEFQK